MEGMFVALFKDAVNLGITEELLKVVEASGLDGAEAREILASDLYVAQVTELERAIRTGSGGRSRLANQSCT